MAHTVARSVAAWRAGETPLLTCPDCELVLCHNRNGDLICRFCGQYFPPGELLERRALDIVARVFGLNLAGAVVKSTDLDPHEQMEML